MKLRHPGILILLLLAPCLLFANEPLVPLIMLYLTPTSIGGALYISAVGFVIIVIIKCAMFLWLSRFRSVWALVYVLLANIVSTSIGLIVAAMFSSADLAFIGSFLLFFIFLVPARRMKYLKWFSRNSIWFIAFVLTLMTIISVVVFAIMMAHQQKPLTYWPLKIFLSTIAISISLIISVLYEETVITGLYKIFHKRRRSFLKPVLWCNIVAVATIVLIGAIIALPERLKSPSFLIGVVSIAFFIGLSREDRK